MRVQLLVYDLTRGMASQLSQPILGARIDGVWHTGLQVFDIEYYYGGGIQASAAGVFAMSHNLLPVRVIDIGTTTKSRAELEMYLRSISNQFSPMTYDLLRNNCNNFTDTISIFLTGQRIPSYILDLPNIVFSTPGGAMLRPMIESMQNNLYAETGSRRLDPFGSPGAVSADNRAVQTQSYSHVEPGAESLAAIGAAQYTTAISSSSSTNSNSAPALVPVPHTPPLPTDAVAILQEQPLVSSDYSTVDILGKKVLNLMTSARKSSTAAATESPTPALADSEKNDVQRLLDLLLAGPSSEMTATTAATQALTALRRVLDEYPTGEMASLFLIRLAVLREDLFRSAICASSSSDQHSLIEYIIRRAGESLGSSSSSSSSSLNTNSNNSDISKAAFAFATAPATVMALCTLANAMSHETGISYILGDNVPMSWRADAVLDIAMRGLTHSRADVRQMSATVAYNFALALTPATSTGKSPSVFLGKGNCNETGVDEQGHELSAHAVQLLIGSLEGAPCEADAPTRYRRLCTGLRILRAGGAAAGSLGTDLGFRDSLDVLSASPPSPINENERLVIHELRAKLNLTTPN